MRSLWYAGVAAAALLAAGCAERQKILITTTPPGAEVWMIKHGVREVHGGARGIYGTAQTEPFEDPELYLGTSPVSFEFEIEEDEGGVYTPAGSISARKIIRDMLIRVRKGASSAERRVGVTGEPMTIEIPLPEPAPAVPTS